MLRLLTRKLKNHSLDDIKPMQQTTDSMYSEDEEDFSNEICIEDLEDSEQQDNKENIEHSNSPNYCIANNNNNNNKNINTEETDELITLATPTRVPSNCEMKTDNKTTLNFSTVKVGGEKRKFSPRSVCNTNTKVQPTYHCDSSSDEEIKDLYAKHKYLTSSRTIINTSLQHSRKIVCIDRCNKEETLGGARPSLNFEKMRQRVLKKTHPRIVKLKTIHSAKSNELNENIAFKPIKLMSGVVGECALVPVEEPSYVF